MSEGGEKSEGELLYEQKKKEKEAEDARKLSEAEVLIKQELDQQEEEIRQLRAKQEARKKQREEEQLRMEERRRAEEARRREEEAIKRRQREETERALQEERQRRNELELQAQKEGRNHLLVPRRKKQSIDEQSESSVEGVQKTKEELEAEKQAVLSQRIVPLTTAGLDVAQLIEKAKDLHDKLYHLECEKYDLEEGVKRRQYDIMELAEKMRQMNKSGKGKKGAGVEAGYDRIQAKYTQAPPKVEVASKYERKLDRRTIEEKVKTYENFVL